MSIFEFRYDIDIIDVKYRDIDVDICIFKSVSKVIRSDILQFSRYPRFQEEMSNFTNFTWCDVLNIISSLDFCLSYSENRITELNVMLISEN